MTPQKCAQCGAMIDPLAHACPYCRFTTPAGVAAHQHAQQQAQQQAQWAAHAQHVQFAAARARLASTATQALVFGILGIVLFCTPLGIVGIVQGFRARAIAREAHAPVPGTATAGLVLAILSLVTSIVGIVLIDRSTQEDKAKADARAAAIEKRLGARMSASEIDRDTACGIVEAHLLREGYAGTAGYFLDDIQCIGKLQKTGPDTAEIDTIRAKNNSTKWEFRACLKRGGKWYVKDTSTGVCPDSD